MKNSIVISGLLTFLLMLSSPAIAQDITWSGDGDSDASGDWSDGDNWGGGVVPTNSEQVILPSVSSGLRTVTQDTTGGVEASAIRFIQSGSDGTNKLSLAGNIKLLTGSYETETENHEHSALRWEFLNGATRDQVVIDLNGFSVFTPNSPRSARGGSNLSGIINFNAPGSSIHSTYAGHYGARIFGKLIVTADGRIGRVNGGSNSTGNANIYVNSTGEIRVTGAEFKLEMYGKRGYDRSFTVSNSGLITFDSDSTLAAVWTALSGSGSYGSLTFQNQAAGRINQGGKLHTRVHSNEQENQFTYIIRNLGEWIVDGNLAVITRLNTSFRPQYLFMPDFLNLASGTLRGNSEEDCLEFDEEEADGTRRMPIFNSGKIAPGAGSAAEDLASVGLLTLRDIDVVMEETGVIELDIGGIKEVEMDRLVLAKGLNDPAVDAGTFDLTEGGTLQLVTANEYDHSASFRRPVIIAGDVTGEFATVKLDGETFVDNELELDNGTRYEVVYKADAVWLYCFGTDNQTTILVY